MPSANEARLLQRKRVYLDDALIGEATAWAEMRELLKAMDAALTGSPGMSEGPTGFYVSGSVATDDEPVSKKSGEGEGN